MATTSVCHPSDIHKANRLSDDDVAWAVWSQKPGRRVYAFPGVYAPLLTFFHPDTEDLDLATFRRHLLFVVGAGVYPVLAGSNGEGPHLSHSERQALITTARQTLDDAGLKDVPIIAGAGATSTRETIELCRDAAGAGADYVLVITGGYFAGALQKDKIAVKAFYTEVAEKSPVPVLIYNYPGASGGIDLDSNLITELAKECPNIVGVKLTCGNVGKLTRISSVVSSPSFASTYPRKAGAGANSVTPPFLVLGGYGDILLSSVYARGHGCITGLANIFPASIAELYKLISSGSSINEAQRIQGIIARADFTISQTGVAGTKALLEKLRGYGGAPRKPLLPYGKENAEQLWSHPDVQEIIHI